MIGSKWIFVLLALCVAVLSVFAIWHPKTDIWYVYGVVLLSGVLLVLLFRSVVMPKLTVMRGMELISAQDFNNRLTNVGEHDADRIVNLFNMMIDRLRNERLRNLEQDSFLSLLIKASPMGVAMLDFDGRFTMANEAFLRITGAGREKDIIGRSLSDLRSELCREMMKVPVGEARVVRRGDVRTYRCYHLSFVQTGFSREFYLIESLTEEVMKAEREAYEKVIRIISHEVNNTMGGVRSVLETIQDVVDDDEIRKVLESCDNRCSQMCGFISSYADVVRVPDPVLSKVDLNGELSRLLPFLRGMVPERISLEADIAAEPVNALIDSALIEQVVINVVKNAFESITGTEGKIVVSVLRKNGNPAIEICNNGTPISDEVSQQLFRPFFTTKREGRGLGLTLVCEILNRHKAQYSLRTYPDGMTRFSIEFPSPGRNMH